MTKHNEGLGVVGWGWGWDIWLGLWVDSGSLISDISDVSIISVGGVGHVLDSAIGKSNGVRSLSGSSTIGGLLSVEVGLGVVISNSVGVGVGGNLIGVGLYWGVVGWGSVDGVGNDWGGVDSVGNNWGVDSVSHNWGVVDSVVDWGVDGVDSVHWGMNSVDKLVSAIWPGSDNSEESSSDKSLKVIKHYIKNHGNFQMYKKKSVNELKLNGFLLVMIYLHFCSIVV